jgi:hypothetical protein
MRDAEGITTITALHLPDIEIGTTKIDGKTVRLCSADNHTAHVYPDWPGHNRKERRAVKAASRRAQL